MPKYRVVFWSALLLFLAGVCIVGGGYAPVNLAGGKEVAAVFLGLFLGGRSDRKMPKEKMEETRPAGEPGSEREAVRERLTLLGNIDQGIPDAAEAVVDSGSGKAGGAVEAAPYSSVLEEETAEVEETEQGRWSKPANNVVNLISHKEPAAFGESFSFPAEKKVKRTELFTVLSQLENLVENIEAGEAEVLQEIRQKAALGRKAVDELLELMETTGEKLIFLKDLFDDLAEVAEGAGRD